MGFLWSIFVLGVISVLSYILLIASVYTSSDVYGLPLFNLLDNEEAPRRGGVSSESALCSRIGIDLIRQGGNAADAV